MIRRIPGALALCCVLASVGCGGELESDYTLNLVPHTLTGQNPFVDGREVELVIVNTDGTSEVVYAGRIEGGQLEANEVPPVPAGSSVGLLIEDAGGASGVVDIDLAVAWGSAVVADGLTNKGNTVTLDVLVAEIGVLGDMDSLPSAKVSLGAGVAMVPGGDVYIFGGAPDLGTNTPATDRIQHMSETDTGKWTFNKLNATVPARDDATGALYGVRASTLIDDDGRALIFVSGGRESPGAIGGATYSSRSGALFDPETQDWDWGHRESHAQMTAGRSEHDHIVMENGKVAIFGGFQDGQTGSVEVFNPNNKRFDVILDPAHGEVYPAGASLGQGGALICGGGILQGAANNTVPTDGCDTITLGGVATDAAPMPVPVLGHAMAHLGNGRILATGGITSTVNDNAANPATNEAWLFNNGQWGPAPSTMVNARAHHVIITLPDGNALILGGTEEGGAVFPTPGPAVVCPELFDAQANTFTELSPCSAAGAGAHPSWTAVPGEGAFVLAGQDADNPSPNGDAFGFIAFTPDI